MVKPSGTSRSCSLSVSSRSRGTAVSGSPPPRAAGLSLLPLAHRALGDRGAQGLVRGAQLGLDRVEERVRLCLGDDAFLDQLGRVLRANRRMLGDLLVHERLRVRRLVALVVAEPAVADDVHDHVAVELGAVGEREPHRRDRRLGIVGVHVDDRRVEALGDVARVARGALVLGIRREPDLVVRDQVQRAAGRVALQTEQVERLGDDPLAREGRVPVDEERERHGRVVLELGRVAPRLKRAGRPLDHRIDGLEVARVGGEPDMHLAVRRRADALRAVVVLHVARAALGVVRDRLELPLALELLEDHLVGTAERVGDHVQPAAVGHAEHDVLGAAARGQLERLVEHRDDHLEPLDRELLLAQERPAQVALEAFRVGEPRQQRLLLLGVELPAVAARLDRVAQPDALLVVRDVLDLVRHRPAVGGAQLREHLAERVPLAVQAQQARRDLRLELRRQPRDQPVGVERRIARAARSRADRGRRRGGRACGAP